ncbi:MAG TPA: hypothetical protein VNO30_09200 [Kofleriaceae bacterium]|nr:hypothetical protein [Kofleriaceae bacterium]
MTPRTRSISPALALLLCAGTAGTARAQQPPPPAPAPAPARPPAAPAPAPARPPAAPAAGTPAPAPAPAPARTAAASAARPRTLIVHVPPLAAEAGAPIELAAQIDAPFAEALIVRWRPTGEEAWREAIFERSSAGGWYATLPPAAPPGVEYFISGVDGAGAAVAHFASASAPHAVRVVPTLVDRLEALERVRQRDRRNEIAVDVIGHNFGNRYGLRDRFLRAELGYTRRVARQLYHVAFGFGAIQGRTPLDESRAGGDDRRAMRYGFGEARVRAHPSIFLDLRGMLGAGEDGFETGIRGAVTFGKPWRSCVTAGAEYLGGVGPTGWVRLQWDTAPPLLMGASIVRTDLPGVEIDPGGLYIAYDVLYRVAERFAVRAQVSYGARDGAANVGGGLGTAVDF